jgi:hypothetical protein
VVEKERERRAELMEARQRLKVLLRTLSGKGREALNGENTETGSNDYSGKKKVCPFRPMDCGTHCALFNDGYSSCCIKLMAASIMKIAEYRKDLTS